MSDHNQLSDIWGANDKPVERSLMERTNEAWAYLANQINDAWKVGYGMGDIRSRFNVDREVIRVIIEGDLSKPKNVTPNWVLTKAKEAGWVDVPADTR